MARPTLPPEVVARIDALRTVAGNAFLDYFLRFHRSGLTHAALQRADKEALALARKYDAAMIEMKKLDHNRRMPWDRLAGRR